MIGHTALRYRPHQIAPAVLVGSQATGAADEHSDVDVLVVLTDPSAARVAQLTGRLERDVQLTRLQEAERTPSLMADALGQGRVLVDRDGGWPALKARAATWRRRADADDVPALHEL